MLLSTATRVLTIVTSSAAQSFQLKNSTQPTEPKNATLYSPLFEKYSNSTPRFHNVSQVNSNSLYVALAGKTTDITILEKRQSGDNGLPVGMCAPGAPCVNGACCGQSGVCGFSPDECGPGNCLSNCKAKAECGQYALEDKAKCSLNVCCSQFGYCGTTDEFCGKGCQSGFGGCGKATEPLCSGTTVKRHIGYYESWSSTRKCDKRLPKDLDLTGFTHMNFAFAFFNPTTFEMMPMDAGDPTLYTEFTNLKESYPGLQTWISIGGWSFNDATNNPNTQTAFSDMASTAANRKKFINSLTNLCKVSGLMVCADIDWEYPGAPDRGGKDVDIENFVTLLKELRAAWGTKYGLSATLPSSYWYLRWFDLKGLEKYLDWLNMMSYDIHGVWDSTNKFTGPFLRPHTNLTEIQLGLDLLWRNNISPAKWGGSPGSCTNSAGTLSNAEIFKILGSTGAKPSFDKEAAVKWITWNSNQWASYDDGETTQMKIRAANKWCLGGTMVWAVDQDDKENSSTNDYLGIGKANGVSSSRALELKNNRRLAQTEATNINSCYWTFCGGKCVDGYFEETYSDGQVNGVSSNTVCEDGKVQTLCCASGTTMGTCSWNGWNGVGLSCGGSCDFAATNNKKRALDSGLDLSGPVAIAFNTNSLGRKGQITWTMIAMTYCCDGFKSSPKGSVSTLDLIGTDGKETNGGKLDVGKFAGLTAACTAGATAAATAAGTAAAIFSFGLGFLPAFTATFAAVFSVCEIKAKEAATMHAVGVVAGVRTGRIQKPQNPRPKPSKPKPPAQAPKQKLFGQWLSLSYDKATDTDCVVTYTCRYGRGHDEICDNQSWGIFEANAGRTVYHYDARGPDNEYAKADWASVHRRPSYRSQAQAGNPARCQVDEFPMGSLWEGRAGLHNQVCRLVNGNANRLQGTDWMQFLYAQWRPCSSLRSALGKGDPPVTWEFDHQPNDPRLVANIFYPHFIQRYGFDSQTPGAECWATYNDPNSGNNPTAVLDHGFRALPNDPMFRRYNWPRQNYNIDPAQLVQNNQQLPQDVASANWLKRSNIRSVLENRMPAESADSAEQPGDVDCNKCKIVIDEENKLVYEKRPIPEVPVTESVVEATSTADLGKARTGQTMISAPAQTGVPKYRQYVRHQDFHNQRREL
ncbi:glycoside hydrolase family 18 protein [Aaosphaeria arxii CBS 175.79]|uniref:chitinase n=1 Tax=Aaosphaeria arxii CBS 175.79 TaxID=1450172 RepID=A0A6A5X640_9PLEO|nr:glycoside hydrolase family 18 protein [Aaosphaeria arxii CBS 175.79]KAF2008423.1 glycoside hydrolase family 18 protein [Aaosphaeria arxii CBS 175.79]